MKKHILIIIPILAILFVIYCGEKQSGSVSGPAQYLPENFENLSLSRISEIRTFAGNALWEYINGGAELYHLYDFIEVATADYKSGDIELVVDIYRFASPDNAFGLYSQFREPDNTILQLGVEGFVAPATLNFVKGSFLMRITGYDDTEANSRMIINLADELNKIVAGTDQPPAAFALLPDENRIAGSDKYYAESFLGHKFLTEVYSRNYAMDGDTVTWFAAADSSGEKFLKWSDFAEKIDRKTPAPEDADFDTDYGFIFDDSYYGPIIVGLKNKWLVGIVKYTPAGKNLLNNWLESI